MKTHCVPAVVVTRESMALWMVLNSVEPSKLTLAQPSGAVVSSAARAAATSERTTQADFIVNDFIWGSFSRGLKKKYEQSMSKIAYYGRHE